MSETVKRIKQLIDIEGLSIRAFESKVGFSNGAFASQLRNNASIGSDKIENILHAFPYVDANWLLKGEGSMHSNIAVQEPRAPYYTAAEKNELEQLRSDNLLLKRIIEEFLNRQQ